MKIIFFIFKKNKKINVRYIEFVQSIGFTLIELMVTISIAAILAGLALPSFSQMLERNRVSVVVNQFTGALTYARNEAVTRNRRVVVCKVQDASLLTPQCDASGGSWRKGWMVFVDENNNSQLDGEDVLLRVVGAIRGGYSLWTAKAAWIAFSADGLGRFKGGVVSATYLVTAPSGSKVIAKEIKIDRVGRARVQDVGG